MNLKGSARGFVTDAAAAIMVSLFLAGNFLRENAYSVWRIESACLILGMAVSVFAGALLFRAARIHPVFYAGLAVFVVDAGTGWLGAVKDTVAAWGLGAFAGWTALTAAAVVIAVLSIPKETLPKIILMGLAVAVIAGCVADAAAPKALIRIAEPSVRQKIQVPVNLPNVLFILLDEHAAFDVFETADKSVRPFEAQARALVERGFSIYDQAISNFSATWDSVPSYLNANVDAGPRHKYLTQKKLNRNKLFAHYRALGYRIHVIQSTHLDYCRTPGVEVDRCLTYESSSMGYLQGTDLHPAQRLRILLGGWMGSQKSRLLKKAAERLMPEPHLMHLMTGALATDNALNEIRKSLAEHPSGTLIFAHILFPHSSYVYDDLCRVKDPSAWLTTADGAFDASTGRVNSDVNRETKYRASADQVVCAHSKLEHLWSWMDQRGQWDSTQILLASDHGSRIFRRSPTAVNRPHMNCSDLSDAYRAFLAVKPAAEPGRQALGRRVEEPVSSVDVIAETFGIFPVVRSEGLSGDSVLLADEKAGGFVPVSYSDCVSK